MKNHYCPNVDRLIVCILLDLIDLTPMHVGIDFNITAIRLAAAQQASTTSRDSWWVATATHKPRSHEVIYELTMDVKNFFCTLQA